MTARSRYDERANDVLTRALREALSNGHNKITVADLERGLARERIDHDAREGRAGRAPGAIEDLVCAGCSWTGSSWAQAKDHILDVLRHGTDVLSHTVRKRRP